MTYSILGAGNVGKALAQAFARKNIDVILASRRSPEELAPIADGIDPNVRPRSLQDAMKADVILLATPFKSIREVAKAAHPGAGQ
jgi:hypothetical protein